MRFMSKTPIVVAALAIVAAACGGAAATADESDTDAAAPTTMTTPSTTTTIPAVPTTHMMAHDDSQEGDGSGDGESSASVADVTIDVSLSEFSFSPENFEVTAGTTVAFVVINEGVIEHEFRVSNEHRIEEHLAAGHEDHGAEEGSHHDEGGDYILLVQPGETAELVVTFPEDTTIYTEIACLLPGHYEAGMKAPISYRDA